MKIIIEIIHVFSPNSIGGYRIGVIEGAETLTTEQKRQIESVASPVEIVYLSESLVADIKMEGHHTDRALLAIAYYTRKKQATGEQMQIEAANEIKTISFKAEVNYLHDSKPFAGVTEENIFQLTNALGISTDFISSGLMPQVIQTGRSFLALPLKDQNILRSIQLNTIVAEKLCKRLGPDGICLFAISLSAYTDAICRTFVRDVCMQEQVSAFAAGHIASFLYDHNYLKRKHIVIEHAPDSRSGMNSLVHVHLDLDGQTITSIQAGGKCHSTGILEIEIADPEMNEPSFRTPDKALH